jgi:hypothetical protein
LVDCFQSVFTAKVNFSQRRLIFTAKVNFFTARVYFHSNRSGVRTTRWSVVSNRYR